jgi:hypothetical protein
MGSSIIMFDSDDDAAFPRGAQAYAAYTDGMVASQPNYAWIVAEFPAARHLSITLSAAEDADCLDVENGAATPGQAAGWWQRQRARGLGRPCLYASASVMQASIVPLVRAGTIARPLVRLWSAHYAGEHICGPASCGAMSLGADGTQWTDRSFNRDLDESLLLADFFDAPAPKPAPSPVPDPVPAWQEAMLNALPVVKLGDTGEPVRTVQGLCIARGHQITCDGDFGPATHSAVAEVQAAAHLAQDGIVGAATWPALAGV